MDSILQNTKQIKVFQIFDSHRLKAMRESSRPLKHHLDEAKRLTGFDHNVELLEDELQLIDIREIHPPGKDLHYKDENGKPQVIPNGFQTRQIIIDEDQVENISNDIKDRYWQVEQLAPVYFILPKIMWYSHPDDPNIMVKYGIIEGNHRTESARRAEQDNMIGWIVDFDLPSIRKIANLVFNTPRNTQVKLSCEDYGEQIITEITEGKTTFGKQYKVASTDEKENLVKSEINSCTKNRAMRGNIEHYIQSKNLYTPAVKAYKQQDAHNYVLNTDLYSRTPDALWDYVSKTNKDNVVILCEDKGAETERQIIKIAKIEKDHPDKKLFFAVNVSSKVAANQKSGASKFREDLINLGDLISESNFSNVNYDVRYIPKSQDDLLHAKKTNNPFLHA